MDGQFETALAPLLLNLQKISSFGLRSKGDSWGKEVLGIKVLSDTRTLSTKGFLALYDDFVPIKKAFQGVLVISNITPNVVTLSFSQQRTADLKLTEKER